MPLEKALKFLDKFIPSSIFIDFLGCFCFVRVTRRWNEKQEGSDSVPSLKV